MAQRLKNIVHFSGLTPNVPAQLPHGLRDSLGHPLVPDLLAPSIEGATITADDTNVFVTVNATAIDVYCEAWHTFERSFGDVAVKELSPQPFVLGGGGSGGQFEPARTLFVSTAWPAGSAPTKFFTTIADALTQASALVPPPSQADPATIIVYPGTYPEDLNLVSGVSIVGAAGAFIEVNVTGDIFWTPVGNGFENAFLYHLTTGSSVNIDTTGKTGGQTSFLGFNCFLEAFNEIGRASGGPTRDLAQFFNCIPGPGPGPTFFSVQAEWNAGRLSNMQFNGDCLFAIAAGTTIPAASLPNSVNDTSTGTVTGANLTTDWNVGAGASVTIAGCALNAVLTVDAAGSADVHGSNYNGNANLVGPGPINRTTHTDAFGPTAIGANAVAFAVPFPDGAYNVSLQLTAGPGNAGVTVTGKTGAGFTINDTVGGNTYDITVIHD
jgi:hypothetical protein